MIRNRRKVLFRGSAAGRGVGCECANRIHGVGREDPGEPLILRKMQKIFELNRIDGLKYAEIASQLDISVKTVESSELSRAVELKCVGRWKITDHLLCFSILCIELKERMICYHRG